MSVRRPVIPLAPARFTALAILVALAGCRDAAAPLSNLGEPLLGRISLQATIPLLQQASTAPPLQTYQLSFWAHVGLSSTVAVNYQPAAGQTKGAPFLFFYIPKNGLVAGGGGSTLTTGDSVAITLTIDPVKFLVDFGPSGTLFARQAPAMLALYYENANLDLNGNGVVDGYDRQMIAQFAIWTSASGNNSWSKLVSANDTARTVIGSPIAHFSQYAISW